MHRYPVMISLFSIALKLMLSIRSCALLVSISLVIMSTYLAPCLFDHSAFAQSADDVSRAVELDKEAKQMISEGKNHEATELYREALTIIDHPDLLINLAKAELQLGESQSAFNACSRALTSPLLTPQAREAAASCVSEAQIQMNQIRALREDISLGRQSSFRWAVFRSSTLGRTSGAGTSSNLILNLMGMSLFHGR